MAKITEFELRDYFYEAPDRLAHLLNEEWALPCILEREVTIGNYGRIDLLRLGIYHDGNINILKADVFELKEGAIDLNAVGQICRDRQGLTQAVFNLGGSFYPEVNGYLIGSKYASGDVCYVVDNIPWLQTHLYDLDLTIGLNLNKSCGWHLNDEGALSKNLSELIELYKATYDQEDEPDKPEILNVIDGGGDGQ